MVHFIADPGLERIIADVLFDPAAAGGHVQIGRHKTVQRLRKAGLGAVIGLEFTPDGQEMRRLISGQKAENPFGISGFA